MATIAGFKRRFDTLYGNGGTNIKNTIADEVSKTADVILDLNRDQLLYGRDADGEQLTPSILEDPYWNDKGGYQAAENYVLFKNRNRDIFDAMMSYTKIQLFPSRSNIRPNLIHSTGSFFFNHFFINVGKTNYSIGSSGLAAPDIEAKYGKVYGLAPQSRVFYYENWLRPRIWGEILKHLGK